MNVLEKAISDLAGALETLETRLENHIDDGEAEREALVSARRQAAVSYTHASQASEDLGAPLIKKKKILSEDDAELAKNSEKEKANGAG